MCHPLTNNPVPVIFSGVETLGEGHVSGRLNLNPVTIANSLSYEPRSKEGDLSYLNLTDNTKKELITETSRHLARNPCEARII